MKHLKVILISVLFMGSFVPYANTMSDYRTRGHDKRSKSSRIIHPKREIKREKRACKAAKKKSITKWPKITIQCPTSVVVGLISAYVVGASYALYHLLYSSDPNTILFS